MTRGFDAVVQGGEPTETIIGVVQVRRARDARTV
jgi:hypothetical protein